MNKYLRMSIPTFGISGPRDARSEEKCAFNVSAMSVLSFSLILCHLFSSFENHFDTLSFVSKFVNNFPK